MSKLKKTRVSALSGRVIDRVVIRHGGDDNYPPSLEIHCLGGIAFYFEPCFKVVGQARTSFSKDGNSDGDARVFETDCLHNDATEGVI